MKKKKSTVINISKPTELKKVSQLKRDKTGNDKVCGNSDLVNPLKMWPLLTTVQMPECQPPAAKNQSESQLSLRNLVFKRRHQIVVIFQVQHRLDDTLIVESLPEAASVGLRGRLRALVHEQGPGFLLEGQIFTATTHMVQLVFKF